MTFIYGYLRMSFEKAFGIIPAVLLTAAFYSLHHAGFQPEFVHLFFVGIMYCSVKHRLNSYSRENLRPIGRARASGLPVVRFWQSFSRVLKTSMLAKMVVSRAMATGNGAERRNPGKRVKITSMQFLPMNFLTKTHKSLSKAMTRPPWRYFFYRGEKLYGV